MSWGMNLDKRSESDRLSREWRRIEGALVPDGVWEVMTESELVALEFLVDCCINSNNCRVESSGKIVAQFDDETEIVLDANKTISMPILSRISSIGSQRRKMWVSVRKKKKLAGRTISLGVCIVPESDSVPPPDYCAAFVLWAESGFLDEVPTVRSSISKLQEQFDLEVCDIIENALEAETARIMSLSWRDLILEHRGGGALHGLHEICAKKVRDLILDPERFGESVADGLIDYSEFTRIILEEYPFFRLNLSENASRSGCARPEEGRQIMQNRRDKSE